MQIHTCINTRIYTHNNIYNDAHIHSKNTHNIHGDTHTSPEYNPCLFNRLLQDTESIVKGAFSLVQNLLGSPSHHDGACFTQWNP